MTTQPSPTAHPWIVALRERMDALENALLQGNPQAVEQASAAVQATLQAAPKTAEFAIPGNNLHEDMRACAARFGQLRQAVMRGNAQGQRALSSLFPHKARPTTYGGLMAGPATSTGGAGRTFLSA